MADHNGPQVGPAKHQDAGTILSQRSTGYARTALANIQREFPADVWHTMQHPGDFPRRPRDRNPAFYGSYDWHSCVEMHWLLVRLLRWEPATVPATETCHVLTEHLSTDNLLGEAEFMADPVNAARQRPYGWGWALSLAEELHTLSTAPATSPAVRQHATAWSAAIAPLTSVLRRHLLDWLATGPHPVRYGLHNNSAFGLTRVLPLAEREAASGNTELLAAITEAAGRWFTDDRAYPVGYEPSGHDFLSPALSEADLMGQVLGSEEFGEWLTTFLPDLSAAFAPVEVSDASDGQTAHLRGLNLSRAAGLVRIAARLPEGDPRCHRLRRTAWSHADAALPYVVGDGYAVEHWLAAYAVWFLTER